MTCFADQCRALGLKVGDTIEGTEGWLGVYTDRLFQWDSEKHDRLCMKHFGNVGQYWDQRDTDAIQAFLRDYLDAPELVLCKMQEHCNQATGYPVWYFAYRKTPGATIRA